MNEKVRRERIAAGISTSELSRFLGVKREWIARRELGFVAMNSEDAERLLSAIRTISEKRFLANGRR